MVFAALTSATLFHGQQQIGCILRPGITGRDIGDEGGLGEASLVSQADALQWGGGFLTLPCSRERLKVCLMASMAGLCGERMAVLVLRQRRRMRWQRQKRSRKSEEEDG